MTFFKKIDKAFDKKDLSFITQVNEKSFNNKNNFIKGVGMKINRKSISPEDSSQINFKNQSQRMQ